MAFKQFALDASTPVTIYKRKASRSLRLSIAADGKVRVSIPTWAPYRAGLEFARSRQGWIEGQRATSQILADGQAIGKAHHLKFMADAPNLNQLAALRAMKSSLLIRPLSVQAARPFKPLLPRLQFVP